MLPTPRPASQPAKTSWLFRPLGRWLSALVLLGLIGFVAWMTATVRVGYCVSESMEPTLGRGDEYVIRIDAYRHSPPQRGDIVVIRDPARSEDLVKRVIAVGGDWVGVIQGRAVVNGVMLSEPYLKDVPGVREKPMMARVPEGKLFLLGDNRNFSEDSRDLGPLPARNVLGRVVSIIYPFSRRREIHRPHFDVPPPES